MDLLRTFKWQGSDRVYSLPWLKNRLEYSSDPERIAAYARTSFTRSRFVMEMLTQFHLSQHSIVVSEDAHARWLKRLSLGYIPSEAVIPQMAQEIVQAVFPPVSDAESRTVQVSDPLIREIYRAMLRYTLGVRVLRPLDEYITATRFPHGTRTMVLEGIMYSLRLHTKALAPVRYVLERTVFKRDHRMLRIARTLEQMVCDFSLPEPGSWFERLAELRASGEISDAQFMGEIRSMLVSSFSLAAALASALLCLAARPRYRAKIRRDPAFAKYFALEVLRLYPPFRQFGYEPAGGDACPEAGGAPHEFIIAVCPLHRNPSYWDAPHRFYPERFQSSDAAKGFSYLPFGMGKRNCPGRRLSMSLLIQTLLHVCSDASPVALEHRESLPRGQSGRLVSFPIEDSLTYRAVAPV